MQAIIYPSAPPASSVVVGQFQVIKRTGKIVPFDSNLIDAAITKAFMATEGKRNEYPDNVPRRIREIAQDLSQQAFSGLQRRLNESGKVHIEDIQDQVELILMRNGHHKVARNYVLYREQHARQRAEMPPRTAAYTVTLADGGSAPLDETRLYELIAEACTNVPDTDPELVITESLKNIYQGIPEQEVNSVLVMSARMLIEAEPNYTFVAARLLLDQLRSESLSQVGGDFPPKATAAEMAELYPEYFGRYLEFGIAQELISPALREFDLAKITAALHPERDFQFTYLGFRTLYDRYFLHNQDTRFELPQAFFMRVAMGLAVSEVDREDRAIEFYRLLSSFDFMSSTPTLFNSGTLRPQLSSCYLTTVPDDLDGIYSAVKDNALLSKFAGGLGNDWSWVRSMGAWIKGTNGKSQGVIPFLKVANDTAVAVNQGGKRRGAVCAYLETWHLDIEEFLELRKNTGDERRRTHDMNTANWIPDLFMQRVMREEPWTLFSPDETGDLHDLCGEAFEQRYLEYEVMAARGELRLHKQIQAVALWRKMLTMLFETGHPWVTFKDPCNLRSPQQHVGVVHSSNLCCIAADQRVVTDRGMLTIGDLYQLGGKNKVIGLDGVYDASEMLLPRPNAPMVEINTKEGYTHKVTPDHKVWVKDKGWTEAQELQRDDLLLIQQLEGVWGKENNPKLSYLMGLIAGDGTFGKFNVFIDIWEHDYQYLEEVQYKVHALLDGNAALNTTSTNQPVFRFSDQHKRARLTSAPLRRLLTEHGFTPETKTTIPQLVWRGDKETVSAYLRGLYQADGHIQASTEVTSLVLASNDLKFIQDLQILWANFGVKSSINEMRQHQWHEMPDGKGGSKKYWSKPLYRLLITSIQGCRIAEGILHLAEQKKSETSEHFTKNIQKTGYTQKLYAHFTELKILPNEDAYCLTVDSDTHAWTVNGMVTKNTEITLNTSKDEIAVCNLGSINLSAHVDESGLNRDKLAATVRTAMRMLDNVIDINYYSVPQARRANLRHRPVGLGIMGFQDALYQLRIPYASQEAAAFADQSMELVSYHAIEASSDLALERGKYHSYPGSLWSQGVLPNDSLHQFKRIRGEWLDTDTSQSLDWEPLRNKVLEQGMRNSNCMAIAPTATISNICGVTQSIEPTFQNLYVKSNLSGEFTVVNPYLVVDLKNRGLWDEMMVNDLKYFDGSAQSIERIPQDLKDLYATAFEIDPEWLVEAGARRQKWLDQSQSLNLYMREPSGKKLDELFKLAWLRGLKTTYYLRSQAATSVEKTTVRGDQAEAEPKACAIDDPECEACQ